MQVVEEQDRGLAVAACTNEVLHELEQLLLALTGVDRRRGCPLFSNAEKIEDHRERGLEATVEKQ